MRLIDADALRKEIHCAYSDDLDILEHIDAQPIVDAVRVIHGKWIVKKLKDTDENKYAVCDQCGQIEGWYDDIGMACATLGERYAHFCPSCGARMDGEYK